MSLLNQCELHKSWANSSRRSKRPKIFLFFFFFFSRYRSPHIFAHVASSAGSEAPRRTIKNSSVYYVNVERLHKISKVQVGSKTKTGLFFLVWLSCDRNLGLNKERCDYSTPTFLSCHPPHPPLSIHMLDPSLPKARLTSASVSHLRPKERERDPFFSR